MIFLPRRYLQQRPLPPRTRARQSQSKPSSSFCVILILLDPFSSFDSDTPRTRCVRFVFGVTAASPNTRFQAACQALPGPDLHRLIAPAWPGGLVSAEHLVRA